MVSKSHGVKIERIVELRNNFPFELGVPVMDNYSTIHRVRSMSHSPSNSLTKFVAAFLVWLWLSCGVAWSVGAGVSLLYTN